MREKISNLLIIIVFVGIITLPQVLSWTFENNNQVASTTENRNLSKKPTFELATITKYPKQFDNYYNDHLPFRTELINLWTNINYDLFNTTVDSRVVMGKEGWLFYRGDNSIEQVQGKMEFSIEEKENILKNLKLNKDKFEEENIEFYVLVLPNKENIYKEYLPGTIPIRDELSRTEKLIKYIKENSDLKLIYPKEELIAQKEKNQIYKKYDTHWNEVGGCIGAIVLEKAIDSNFSYDIAKIEIEETNNKEERDLVNFASLTNKLYENKVKVNNFYNEISYEVTINSQYEEYISNSTNEKTILFVGDSFRDSLKPYFSKLYKRVIYIHKDKYTEDLIQKLQPDIVIDQTVERLSKTLRKQLIK